MNSGVIGSFPASFKLKAHRGILLACWIGGDNFRTFFFSFPETILYITTSVPRAGLGVAVGWDHRSREIIPTCTLTMRSKA